MQFWQDLWILTLPQETGYHGNRMSHFPNIRFLLENPEKINLAIICLNFTFSTIFLVNNSRRAIKVLVNKVLYCRTGHYVFNQTESETILLDYCLTTMVI